MDMYFTDKMRLTDKVFDSVAKLEYNATKLSFVQISKKKRTEREKEIFAQN